MRRLSLSVLTMLVCMEACGCGKGLATQHKVQTAEATLTACPAKDFRVFLKAFSADAEIRSRFTADDVLVTDWNNLDDPDQGTKSYSVRKSDYREFTLRYSEGGFHHAASDGSVDPDPLVVDVKPGADGQFLVAYRYGMSEGNSWLFTPRGGCWYLTADPEPAAE